MRAYRFTNKRDLRAGFWADHAGVSSVTRKKIPNFSGNGRMYDTDTRCAFCDWLDMLAKNGDISEQLANRATLD